MVFVWNKVVMLHCSVIQLYCVCILGVLARYSDVPSAGLLVFTLGFGYRTIAIVMLIACVWLGI